MIKKIVMFVVMVALMMACGNRPEIKDEINGKIYALRERVVLEEGQEIAFTLRFDGDRLGGRALNNYNSSYEIEGSSMKIHPMATTLMAGPEILMEREAEYLADLTKVKGIALEDGTLILTTEDGKELIFDEIEDKQ